VEEAAAGKVYSEDISYFFFRDHFVNYLMKNKLLSISILALFFSKTSFTQSPNIDSLLVVISKPAEDTGKVIAYRMLAGLIVSTKPMKAVVYGKSGVLLGEKIGFDKGVAGCYLNIAGAYSAGGKLDSALIYIDTAVTWARKVGEPGRISLSYLNRADYYRQMGNMKQALKDCDTSMVYAEKANRDDTKARIYQTIGSVYHAQDNWEQSKLYYEKGYQLYEKANNKKMMAISMNNLGNVYKHLKEYGTAITSFQNAIHLGNEIDDQNNMSMFYSNLADVYIEKGDWQRAEASGLKSLALARSQENELEIAGAQTVLSGIYLKMGKVSAAIRSSAEAYMLATKNELMSERQTAADELAEGYSKTADYKEAYRYMQISKELMDSVSHEKFADEVATMQTDFKVIEKDKEIQLLAKDKLLQQQKLKEQRLMMIGAAILALVALIGVWLLINRSKLRQRMKELELRNQIAADLHDEVGSSLSSIHMLSQMGTTNEAVGHQKNIMNKVSSNAKETMDRMSDIVWMIKPGEKETGSLGQRMERFANEICSSKNIELSIDLLAIENIKFSMAQRKNIYLIFKEALNNAVKYSGTKKIDVKGVINNKQLELQVRDYGNGFDTSISGRGNGLDNMKNRSKELNGKLQLISMEQGTTVDLVVPV
jgi:two-component system, NarL family, sensor histidine kinase UhpB